MSGDFDGATFQPDRDGDRLQRQLTAVKAAMDSKRNVVTFDMGRPVDIHQERQWWTLADLERQVGAPQASISARLRDLRKPKHGGHTVERRYVADGVWEYRYTPKGEQ